MTDRWSQVGEGEDRIGSQGQLDVGWRETEEKKRGKNSEKEEWESQVGEQSVKKQTAANLDVLLGWLTSSTIYEAQVKDLMEYSSLAWWAPLQQHTTSQLV